MYKKIAGYCLLAILLATATSFKKKEKQHYFQLTVYQYNTADQEKIIDEYLEKALLPALHKNNIKNVGVFKAWSNDTAAVKKLYVLADFENFNQINTVSEKIVQDDVYQSAAAAYVDATYKNPPYSRKQVIILKAFPLAPTLTLPALNGARKDRVYELRSYESATEKIFRSKVKMFNEGDEIGIFKKLNFNAVFYSEVVAGDKMPNLMYMTTHENMQERDLHWKNFGADTSWNRLKSMDEYQNNVSHIDISFLYPTSYSDY